MLRLDFYDKILGICYHIILQMILALTATIEVTDNGDKQILN